MQIKRGIASYCDDWKTPILNYEIIRASHKHKKRTEISDLLGVGYSSVRTVLNNWNSGGIKTIFPRKTERKDTKFTEKQKRCIGVLWIVYADKKPPLEEVQRLIKSRNIANVNHPDEVRRVLAELGLKTNKFTENDIDAAISALSGTEDQKEIKSIWKSLEKIKTDAKFEKRWDAIREILLSDKPNKSEIGRKYDLKHSILHHYINRYLKFGLFGLISKEEGPKERYTATIQKEIEVIKAWENGMRDREISEKEIMNINTVRKVLKRYKLKRTTKKFKTLREDFVKQRAGRYIIQPYIEPYENNYIDKEFVQWTSELKEKPLSICMPGFLMMAPIIDKLNLQNWVQHLGISKQMGFEIFHILLVDIGRKILGLENIKQLDTCTDKGLAAGCGLQRLPRSTTERTNLFRITEEHAKKLSLTLGRKTIEFGLSDGANMAFDFKLVTYTGSDKDVKEEKGMGHNTTKGKMEYGDLVLLAYDFENNVPVIGKRYDGKARGKSEICEFIEEIYEPAVGIDKLKVVIADAEFPSRKVLDYFAKKQIEVIMAYPSSKKTNDLIEMFSDKFQGMKGTRDKYFVMRLEVHKRLTNYSLICVKKDTGKTFLFATTRNLLAIESDEERIEEIKKTLKTYRKRGKIEIEIKNEIGSFFIDIRPSLDETVTELHIFTTIFASIAYKLFKRKLNGVIGSKTAKTMRSELFTAKNVELYCKDNKLVMKFVDEFKDREQIRLLMAAKEFLDKEGDSIQYLNGLGVRIEFGEKLEKSIKKMKI